MSNNQTTVNTTIIGAQMIMTNETTNNNIHKEKNFDDTDFCKIKNQIPEWEKIYNKRI